MLLMLIVTSYVFMMNRMVYYQTFKPKWSETSKASLDLNECFLYIKSKWSGVIVASHFHDALTLFQIWVKWGTASLNLSEHYDYIKYKWSEVNQAHLKVINYENIKSKRGELSSASLNLSECYKYIIFKWGKVHVGSLKSNEMTKYQILVKCSLTTLKWTW